MVLPVRNGGRVLAGQLEALAGQSYRGDWELVVADNGSTDETAEVAAAWEGRIPRMRIVDASARRGGAAACNIGARASSGPRLAFCDHDDAVSPGWLEALAAALERADLVTGRCVLADPEGGRIAAGGNGAGPGLFPYSFLPYGLSANLGVTRRTFAALGGFDESLTVGYDVDLCWRAQLAGFTFAFEPAALIAKRARSRAAEAWRQHVAFGRTDPALYRRFRPHGMARSLSDPLRAYAWLLMHLPGLVDPAIRRVWVRAAARRWGRLAGSMAERVLYL